MFTLKRPGLGPVLGIAAFAMMAASTHALTVDLDGTTYTKLSDAVAAVYASDEDGDDIINITASSLSDVDVQILLDKPITINGDPDSDGSCDILVDTAGIASTANLAGSLSDKSYIEITAPGVVNINNIRFHPNSQGAFGAAGTTVKGMTCGNPLALEDVGEYTFTNLEFSGSDSANGNAFVPLDNGDDLYNNPDIYKWPGRDGSNAQASNFSVVMLKISAGAGVYNTVFDHCKAGLTHGVAFNIKVNGGSHQILGGVYGHSGQDGIHIENPVAVPLGTYGVTIKGTHDDRVRVLRTTNITGNNSHGIEVAAGGKLDLLEYTDIAGMTSANNLSFQNGSLIDTVRFVRVMGKNDANAESKNHAAYITGPDTQIGTFENCTFYANGVGAFGQVPFSIQSTIVDPIEIKDCIFTCDAAEGTSDSVFVGGPLESQPTHEFINCALPTDGFLGESLAVPPIIGDGTWSEVGTVSTSPDYMLPSSEYDWSDNQGAGMVGNAVGNANVLRPSNPEYQTASSTSEALNGGAGAPAAGIDSSVWMLMQ